MRFFATGLLLIISATFDAQPPGNVVIKNLQSNWKTFSNNQYKDYDPAKYSRTIYFLVDADVYRGATLQVESQKEFSIFISGKLIASRKKGVIGYNLDSLSALYFSPLNVSIMRSTANITTQLVVNNSALEKNEILVKRKEQYFLNFSILASLLLLVFFVALLRANPKLTFDYLNFAHKSRVILKRH